MLAWGWLPARIGCHICLVLLMVMLLLLLLACFLGLGRESFPAFNNFEQVVIHGECIEGVLLRCDGSVGEGGGNSALQATSLLVQLRCNLSCLVVFNLILFTKIIKHAAKELSNLAPEGDLLLHLVLLRLLCSGGIRRRVSILMG